jgi:hypothetical protein
MSLVAASTISPSPPLLGALELSRSVKENHGTKIKQIASPISSCYFSNLVAVLSTSQVSNLISFTRLQI